ncbi:MAG: VIT1/CCC1 transporter family protein [Candidatus Zhuqueibacterota bacterium]
MSVEKQPISPELVNQLIIYQKAEITAHHIYARLANRTRDTQNRKLLKSIASDELKHYRILKNHTGKDVGPDRAKIFLFVWLSRLLGLTFGLKLLEKAEEQDQMNYLGVEHLFHEMKQVLLDEESHELELLNLINEESLSYVGSIVLGLNDALVELTGTLAGLTFAFQNTRLIALSGLITGIAASLSMAVSDYLSKRAEGGEKNALKSAIYTGIAYIITVALLISPYLFTQNYFICLIIVLSIAVLIILAFNFYLSVAKDYPFARRFWEMVALSLGVAAISFGIGYLLRVTVGIDI